MIASLQLHFSFALRRKEGACSSVDRALASGAGAAGSNPARRARMSRLLSGSLAQLVEQLTLNQRATGSIPVRPTIFFKQTSLKTRQAGRKSARLP